MKYAIALGLLVFSLAGASFCLAAEQQAHKDGQTAMTEANREYMRAMDDMHKPMMQGVMDPDPDAAFVRGMIPHHRGAVDMARIELKYGKDPELRKLAQDIIEAQETEIKFMEGWLKSRGLKP